MGAERERVQSFGSLGNGLRDASPWYLWGPYLSERQWGTVGEDYSPNGEAWGYLPHDRARSQAYRWGEDGLAGFSDVEQRMCLALALWNGRDPILKERAYGLTGAEGNHGEDVKEYWWYCDTMRDFWRSHQGLIGEFATRFVGSSDLYGGRGRRPTASVNLITVHDGFTLADLVSYDTKHNEANREDNRDGADDNRSWNCGAEGPVNDRAVLALRARQKRALLTTLMLSFGVPLLLGGDEFGRTQHGNNNAYCQDGPMTWFDWDSADEELLEFTRRLIAFRRAHPVFRRRRFLSGIDWQQLRWYAPAGTIMTGEQWADPNGRSVAVYLEGQDAPDTATDGSLLIDDDFLMLINSGWEAVDFVLPPTCAGQDWTVEIDSFDPSAAATHGKPSAGDQVTVSPRSILLLRGTARSAKRAGNHGRI